jgi:hypothetical protein
MANRHQLTPVILGELNNVRDVDMRCDGFEAGWRTGIFRAVGTDPGQRICRGQVVFKMLPSLCSWVRGDLQKFSAAVLHVTIGQCDIYASVVMSVNGVGYLRM